MYHSSYDYPSWLPLALEALLLVVGAAILRFRPRLTEALGRRAGRVSHRLGRQPRRTIAFLVVATLVVHVLLTLALGFPIPAISDELSYLLAADTFASGRLANPSHPFSRHFETAHVLHEPTYVSKYPPAQGLVLAAGQLLGHPGVGLWLSSALLVAACGWAFAVWLPGRWAVFATALVTLQLGVGSYWSQSYWGGSITAAGGALLFGGLRRLWTRPGWASGLAVASGVVVLANSRPYEGLLTALPAAVAVAFWLLRPTPPPPGTAGVPPASPSAMGSSEGSSQGRSRGRRVAVATMAAVAAAGLLFMATYDRATTGDPWTLPYTVHQTIHGYAPVFVFEKPGDETPPPSLAPADLYFVDAPGEYDHPWPLRAARQTLRRGARLATGVLGLGMTLALLLGFGSRSGSWTGFAKLTILVVAVGQGLSRTWHPHYGAPITVLLVLVAVLGLRRAVATLRHRGGRLLPALVLAIAAVLFLVQIPAFRPDPGDWARERHDILARLEATPGRDLVLVRLRGMTWIGNPADLEGAEVIAGFERTPEENRRLLDHFADRRVWVVDWTRDGRTSLVPYDEAGP